MSDTALLEPPPSATVSSAVSLTDLVLVRLLPARDSVALAKLRNDMRSFFRRPPSAEQVAGAIAVLRGDGYVTSKGQRVTDAGRARALQFLGVETLEDGQQLDIDSLLGRGRSAVLGKTKLAVINTQFLGDATTTDFWVSQFLLAVDRWRAKNPAPEGVLQAVFMFDEADQYLPAVGKPATKGPMESLLKRARSAGIGLFLATQSPGDFDYRCRDQVLTWLIGRVKEPVAISKLKPMLEGRSGAADKLAEQKAGEFFLVRESDVSPIRTDQNIIPTQQLPEERILEVARLGVSTH